MWASVLLCAAANRAPFARKAPLLQRRFIAHWPSSRAQHPEVLGPQALALPEAAVALPGEAVAETFEPTLEESRAYLERLWKTDDDDEDGRAPLRFETIEVEVFRTWLFEWSTGADTQMLIDHKDERDLAGSEDAGVEPHLWYAYQQRLQHLAYDVSSRKERVFVAAYVGERPLPRFVVMVDYGENLLSTLLSTEPRHCSVEAVAWEPYFPGTSEEQLQDKGELLDWLQEEMGCDPFFFDFSPDR